MLNPAVDNVLALDFDGVLCDSARETGVTAWRAGRHVWPGEWDNEDPPSAVLERFCQLRPLLETGYQAIPLMRLSWEEYSREEVGSRFEDLLAGAIAKTGRTVDELIQLFGETRDAWLREDPDGWLQCHRFFPGTVQRLVRALERWPVYILTTKQERFVRRLLSAQNVLFPHERIFGLDTGKKKTEILRELSIAWPGANRALHFVEDRLATLDKVASVPGLARVHLYLAGWGYNIDDDRARAKADSRISVLTLADFLQDDGCQS